MLYTRQDSWLQNQETWFKQTKKEEKLIESEVPKCRSGGVLEMGGIDAMATHVSLSPSPSGGRRRLPGPAALLRLDPHSTCPS